MVKLNIARMARRSQVAAEQLPRRTAAAKPARTAVVKEQATVTGRADGVVSGEVSWRDVMNLEFYRDYLLSPTGRRYVLDDCDVDASGRDYVWLRPVQEDGRPADTRRRRLFEDDLAGWRVDGHIPQWRIARRA